MTLYRVGGDRAGASTSQRAVMVSAHLVWLATLLAGIVGTAVTAVRERRRGLVTSSTADAAP